MATAPNHHGHPYQHHVPIHSSQIIFQNTPGRKPVNAAISHSQQNPDASASMHISSRPASIMSTTSIEITPFSTAPTLPGPGGFNAFSPDVMSVPNTRATDTSSQYSHRHSITTIGAGTAYTPYQNRSASSNTSSINSPSHPGQSLSTGSPQQTSFQSFHQFICAFCKTPVSPTANYHECLDCAFFKHITILCPTCFAMSPKHVKHHHERSKFVASWDPFVHEPSWQIPGWEVRKTIMGLVWYHQKETKYKTFQRPAPPVDLVRAQTVPASATSYQFAEQQQPVQDLNAQQAAPSQTISQPYPTQPLTQTQQVDAELPLPPGWREMMAKDDKIYYRNETTLETSWTRPTQEQQLIQGWEQRSDPDGRAFYFNSKTQQATWDRPRIGASFSIPGRRPNELNARKLSSNAMQLSTALQNVRMPNSTHVNVAANTVKDMTKKSALGMKSAAKNFKNNKKAQKFIANVGVGLVGGLVKEVIGIGGVDGGAEVLAAVGMGVANAALNNRHPGIGVGTAVMGLMDANDANDGAILAKMAMQVAQGIVDQKMGTGLNSGVQNHGLNGVSQVGEVNLGHSGALQGQLGPVQEKPAPGTSFGAGTNINMEALAAAILEIAALQKATASQPTRPRQGGTTKKRNKIMGVGKPAETTIPAIELQPATMDETLQPQKTKKKKKPVAAETPEVVAIVPPMNKPVGSQPFFEIVTDSTASPPTTLQEEISSEIKQISPSIVVSASDSLDNRANPAVEAPRSTAIKTPTLAPVKAKKGRRPLPTHVSHIANHAEPEVLPAQYQPTEVPHTEFTHTQLPSAQGPPSIPQSHTPQSQGHPSQAHLTISSFEAQTPIQQTNFVLNMPGTSSTGNATHYLSQHQAATGASYKPSSQMNTLAYTPQLYVPGEEQQNLPTVSQQAAHFYNQHPYNPPPSRPHLQHVHNTHHHHQDAQQNSNSGADTTEVQNPCSAQYNVDQQTQFSATTNGRLDQGIDQDDLTIAQQDSDDEDEEDDDDDDDDNDEGDGGNDDNDDDGGDDEGEDDETDVDGDNENLYAETDVDAAEYEVDEDEEDEGEEDCNDSFEEINAGFFDVADFQDSSQIGAFSMEPSESRSTDGDSDFLQTETDTTFQATFVSPIGTDSTFQQAIAFEQESSNMTSGASDDTSWTGGMGIGMDGFYGSYASSDAQDYVGGW